MTQWKPTLQMLGYGLIKIPLLFVVQPRIIKVTETDCEIKIPLNYWTRNHLKTMYFGALSIGADLAGGVMALDAIARSKNKVVFLFKDFKADFLKRAESDVHFVSHDGAIIRKAVAETVKTKQRTQAAFHIVATTPKVTGDEPIAKFALTISVKAQ